MICLLVGCAGIGGSSHSQNSAPGKYLLVLGDSLSTGYRAGTPGDPGCVKPKIDATGAGGWACVVLAKLQARNPADRITNLAVDSEDTCAYFTGRSCEGTKLGGPVPQGAGAAGFLRAHRGQIRLITLEIGADNFSALSRTAAEGHDVAAPAAAVLRQVMRDYDRIVARLHALAPHTPIFLLGYFVPQVPAIIPDPIRTQLQGLVESYSSRLNRFYASEASRYHVYYVDLSGPFKGRTVTLLNPNDIHPSTEGQQVMAREVWQAYLNYAK